jgi:murein L,D-transpeptidase YcbB/YkuD
MRYLFASFTVFVLLLTCFSCRTARPVQAVASLKKMAMPPVPVAIPSDSSNACYDGLIWKATVVNFYNSRNGEPVWVDSSSTTALADSMIGFMRSVNDYGLDPKDYHLSQITSTLENETLAQELTFLDVWLTDAFFAIASDLASSRDSKKRTTHDSLERELLTRILAGADLRKTIETKEPKYAGYDALKTELRASLDSLTEKSDPDSGRFTSKIKSIKINLDRWRNETISFSDRYVFINIPSFMLYVKDHDSIIFSSKVIVGATRSPTPEITSMIECFTIYPYWNVPRKIAVEEYLPMIQKDTSFIRRNNFDVLDRKGNILKSDSLNWTKFHKGYFPVALRQREGEENSLGIIKFLFDNPHAVYLHDTNAKKLFKSAKRSFSHGCIRMERAIDLANFLVTGSLKKKSTIIEKTVLEKERKTVNLAKPIPIYIRYLTADVVNGHFHQYDDVYGLDSTSEEIMTNVGSQK